ARRGGSLLARARRARSENVVGMDARRPRSRPAPAAAAQVHLVAGNERGLTRAGSRLSAHGSRIRSVLPDCKPPHSHYYPSKRGDRACPKAQSPKPRAGHATSMRAVVLLSGGLDSYTAAAIAQRDAFELYALTVNYGQRH